MLKNKVIVDPKTGLMETAPDWESLGADAKLQRTRRELRDMLSGNTPFHEDAMAAPKADAPLPSVDFLLKETNAILEGDFFTLGPFKGLDRFYAKGPDAAPHREVVPLTPTRYTLAADAGTSSAVEWNGNLHKLHEAILKFSLRKRLPDA